ncbi:hypothetical protein STENM327S_06302 [Streptomyces tendae]
MCLRCWALAQFGVVWFGRDRAACRCSCFCSAVSGFGGGAIFPLFAALTADYFGENNNASNYGMVYSSKLVGLVAARAWAPMVVGAWGYEGAFSPGGLHLDLRRVRGPVPASAGTLEGQAHHAQPPAAREG